MRYLPAHFAGNSAAHRCGIARRQCRRRHQAVRAKHMALTTQIGPCIHLFHLRCSHSTRKSTMPTISVARQQYAGQHILLIRRKIPRPDLQGMLSECFGKLFGHGHKAGLPIAGWPVARYLSVGPGLWTVEAAMPVATAAPGEGEMEPGMLPAGPVALGIHGGPYEQLPETYAAIEKWMEANGERQGGAPWESYVTDPAQHPDPGRLEDRSVLAARNDIAVGTLSAQTAARLGMHSRCSGAVAVPSSRPMLAPLKSRRHARPAQCPAHAVLVGVPPGTPLAPPTSTPIRRSCSPPSQLL